MENNEHYSTARRKVSPLLHGIPAIFATALLFTAKAQGQSMTTQYYNPAAATPKPAVATAKPSSQSAAPAAVVTPVPVQKNINDIARFIAGLPPENGGQLAELAKTPEWTAYAASMNSKWPKFDYVKLQQIRVWSAKELADRRINTVFYPFSGPDFIYAVTYFPQASTYILCGLEPVGDIPSVEKIQPLQISLTWLQDSMKTLFNAGYFVTADMGVDLKASPLQGTLPILCVMLARSGHHINSIIASSSRTEIRFVSPAGGKEHILYYFSADLSNGGFGKGNAFYNFVKNALPDTAYMKSASYLMHEDGFSAVRNFLLSQCSTIVQDDSGIPLRSFDANRWALKLYGSYNAPLDIFAKYNQPDMTALYAKTQATPLTFGAGYHWSWKDANLMVATAKSAGKPVAPPAARTQPGKR